MDVVETLSTVLPVIACSSVVLLLLVNVYLRIRRRFPVRVNCWFCNEWTKVSYDNRNSFHCPSCTQYNGFTEDGSYNKIISEQHDELLNKPLPEQTKNIDLAASNGLCRICNNNQQLKVYQLASFTPLIEENYDKEIEHFEKQLERAYKLCPKCETVLQQTILNQNKWLLGLKLVKLRNKSLSLLDLDKSSHQIPKKVKKSILLTSFNVFNLIFATLILLNIILKIDYSDRNIKQYSPKILLPTVLFLKYYALQFWAILSDFYAQLLRLSGITFSKTLFDNLLNSLVNLKDNFINSIIGARYVNNSSTNMTEIVASAIPSLNIPMKNVSSLTFMSLTGFLLQLIIFLCGNIHDKSNILKTMAWIVLTLMNYGAFSGITTLVQSKSVQVLLSSVVIYFTCIQTQTLHSKRRSKRAKKLKHQHGFKKLQKSARENYCSDEEDLSDKSILHNGTRMNSTLRSSLSDSGSTDTALTSCSASPVKSTYQPSNHVFGEPAFIQSHLNKSPRSVSQMSIGGHSNMNTSLNHTNMNTSLNNTFSSYKSAFNDNTMLYTLPNGTGNLDLNTSFGRLKVGNLDNGRKVQNQSFKNPSVFNVTSVLRPKPVLSPSRLNLNEFNKNSWAAGGFWEGSEIFPVNNSSANLSRSSSQTSGFISQSGMPENSFYSSLPPSRNHSPVREFDRSSFLSEPVYHVNSFNEPHRPLTELNRSFTYRSSNGTNQMYTEHSHNSNKNNHQFSHHLNDANKRHHGGNFGHQNHQHFSDQLRNFNGNRNETYNGNRNESFNGNRNESFNGNRNESFNGNRNEIFNRNESFNRHETFNEPNHIFNETKSVFGQSSRSPSELNSNFVSISNVPGNVLPFGPQSPTHSVFSSFSQKMQNNMPFTSSAQNNKECPSNIHDRFGSSLSLSSDFSRKNSVSPNSSFNVFNGSSSNLLNSTLTK